MGVKSLFSEIVKYTISGSDAGDLAVIKGKAAAPHHMGNFSENSDLQTIIEKIEVCAGSCSALISSGETVETKCMHTPVLA